MNVGEMTGWEQVVELFQHLSSSRLGQLLGAFHRMVQRLWATCWPLVKWGCAAVFLLWLGVVAFEAFHFTPWYDETCMLDPAFYMARGGLPQSHIAIDTIGVVPFVLNYPLFMLLLTGVMRLAGVNFWVIRGLCLALVLAGTGLVVWGLVRRRIFDGFHGLLFALFFLLTIPASCVGLMARPECLGVFLVALLLSTFAGEGRAARAGCFLIAFLLPWNGMQWVFLRGMFVFFLWLFVGGRFSGLCLCAAGLFTALLLVLRCLLPPVVWDSTEFFDMPTYHLPTAQLLIERWNPMSDPLAEGICAHLGLDIWGMAPLQVAFMPKALAIFAAVAHSFVVDPTGLTVPGLALLWLGVALQAMRMSRGLSRMAVLAALVWILPLVHGHVCVDLAFAFAAFGLMLAMAEHLKGKPCDLLSLAVWTIWMMNAKLNGVLAAFVFWFLFAGAVLWRNRLEWRRWLVRFAVFAAGVTLAWGLFSWNPMVTSWRLCVHPFYPFATVDEGTWPVKNLAWDLRLVNDDMRQMDKAGIWVHEYVSPRLATAYYAWETGKNDFNPERRFPYSNWMFMEDWVRWWMWTGFAVLLAFPRGRLFAVGGLLLSFLVPKECIGYMRYAPWMSSMGCLGVVLGAEWMETKLGRRTDRALSRVDIASFACLEALWLWHHARDVEFKAAELASPQTRIHFFFPIVQSVEGIDPDDFPALYDYSTVAENQCRLLVKELGWEVKVHPTYGWQPCMNDKVKTIPLWTLDQRQWLTEKEKRNERDLVELGAPWLGGNVWDGWNGPENAERWIQSPWLFWKPLSDAHTIVAYYTFAALRDGETAVGRQWHRVKAAAHAWGVTYPKEVLKWLCGRGPCNGRFSRASSTDV